MNARIRQAIYIGLPILIVAATVLLFNAGAALKQSAGARDLAGSLEQLLSLTAAQDWEGAHAAAERAGTAWRRVRGRIYLTSTTDDIEQFDLELAGLRGALEGGDRAQAQMAVRRLLALWEDLGV